MRALTAALLLTTCFPVACGQPAAPPSASPAADPAPGRALPQGHVYTLVADEPVHLNPFTTDGAVARRYVLAYTHDTLLDSDPKTGALRPALARSWQVADDGLSFTVTLRPGVTFADGAPLTADDVLYTWQVAKAEPSLLGAIGEGLALVRDVELLESAPEQLRIHLRERHFAAVRAVGESWMVVQRRFFTDRIAALAAASGRSTAPAPGEPGFGDLLSKVQECGPGSGPYRLGEWRRKQDLTLQRSDTSWRRQERPGTWNLGGFRIVFARDPAARFALLQKHQLDWYSGERLDQLLQDAALQRGYRKLVFDHRNLGVYLVAWNHRRPLLADARVRRALGMLFDRATLAGKLLEGDATPAAAFGKRGDPAYPADLQPLPYDPSAARALLRAAGHDPAQGTALRLELLAPAGGPEFVRRCLDLAAAAGREAGIDLQVQLLEPGLVQARRQSGEWDGLLRYQQFRNWCDPYDQFHSHGNGNDLGFADAECDRLLATARGELDDGRRAALYQAFHRRAAELQPVALLVHPLSALLVNRALREAEPGVLGLSPERMWVPPELQRQ